VINWKLRDQDRPAGAGDDAEARRADAARAKRFIVMEGVVESDLYGIGIPGAFQSSAKRASASAPARSVPHQRASSRTTAAT